MTKKLPKIFANNEKKCFDNNDKVFYSKIEKNDNNQDDRLTNNSIDKRNVYQKINDIFNSERYVYKANVEIRTSKGNIETKIIGQNKTHLITINNELIPIVDIEDINYID